MTVDRSLTVKSEKIKIDDVARALGISKSTVSRSISGKGRISEATRARVMAYIEEHDYIPNPIAKGLALHKTYNIGWVEAGESVVTDLPFFQRCLTGVTDAAVSLNYDVLLSMTYDNDITALKRIVDLNKVDGIILSRTLMNDEAVHYLAKNNIPFVTIGSTPEPSAIQVDNDHIKACHELTSVLIMKGMRKFMLIGGSDNHVVNCTRRNGFECAIRDNGDKDLEYKVYMNCDRPADIKPAVEEALAYNYDCIICTDDRVCLMVLEKLHKDEVSIPEDIKIASFYNSDLIANNNPGITALSYDPKELGREAVRLLVKYLEGGNIPQKKLLGYEVLLKGSTQ